LTSKLSTTSIPVNFDSELLLSYFYFGILLFKSLLELVMLADPITVLSKC